jgi:hypothetical protein
MFPLQTHSNDVVSGFISRIYANTTVLIRDTLVVFRDAIWVFDPLASKHGEPDILSIVKFPYFLYEPVVSDVASGFINRIYANTTVLIRDTLIVFRLRIVGVPINFVCLP